MNIHNNPKVPYKTDTESLEKSPSDETGTTPTANTPTIGTKPPPPPMPLAKKKQEGLSQTGRSTPNISRQPTLLPPQAVSRSGPPTGIRSTNVEVRKKQPLKIELMMLPEHSKVPENKMMDLVQEKVKISSEEDSRLGQCLNRKETESLLASIEKYDETGVRQPVEAIIRQLGNYQTRKRLKEAGFTDDRLNTICSELFEHMEKNTPVPLPDVPEKVYKIIDRDCVNHLNQASRYICLNAATYAPKVLKDHKDAHNIPINREKIKTQLLSEEDMAASRSAGMSTHQFTRERLEYVGKGVDQMKGGFCTSFAMFAAHHLVEAAKKEGSGIERIECLSGPDHCYVVVNRKDTGNEQNLKGKTMVPGAKAWAKDTAILVDVWAASLGFPAFYTAPEDFPLSLQPYIYGVVTREFEWVKGGGKDNIKPSDAEGLGEEVALQKPIPLNLLKMLESEAVVNDLTRFSEEYMRPETRTNLINRGMDEKSISDFQREVAKFLKRDPIDSKLAAYAFAEKWKANPQLVEIFGWGETMQDLISQLPPPLS
jgi:hypothetical protein